MSYMRNKLKINEVEPPSLYPYAAAGSWAPFDP
jgi:hypothetical protein